MLLALQWQSLYVFLSSSAVAAPTACSPTESVYCHHNSHPGNCQMKQNGVFLFFVGNLHPSITTETQLLTVLTSSYNSITFEVFKQAFLSNNMIFLILLCQANIHVINMQPLPITDLGGTLQWTIALKQNYYQTSLIEQSSVQCTCKAISWWIRLQKRPHIYSAVQAVKSWVLYITACTTNL